jgi:hypothetical protein
VSERRKGQRGTTPKATRPFHVSHKKRSAKPAETFRKKAPPPPPAAKLIVVDKADNVNEDGIVEIDSQVDLPKTGNLGSYSNNELADESDGDKTAMGRQDCCGRQQKPVSRSFGRRLLWFLFEVPL